MAVSNVKWPMSFTAEGDLSASQFLVLKSSTTQDNTVIKATGSLGPYIGVLQNKPEAGQEAAVAMGGIVKIYAGARVTEGDKLTVDSAAKIIPVANATNYLSSIDQDLCVGCGTCVEKCYNNAIYLNDDNKAERIEEYCVGCGVCAYLCPENAISMIEGQRIVRMTPPRRE